MSFNIQSLYEWYRRTLRHPKYRWWIILGTLVYLLSPIDISPDFLPIVGQVDDIALLTLLVAELSQIVVDYFKSRQSENSVPSSTAAGDTSHRGESTVEVEATSLE
ncbi:MAG TPA: DUF1232 domain-containing protein [Oscillatoriaceae cyanobacterium M33_DOE_052]|uniref:DUF1232 domain-containing protein n=1 Tax=Planktothricoides sp. SpSt-374 TaxID=2282167 RepID=A0A7C3VPY9_9CYAN|nr:DUF1232 domain-containing protein [Oscillatoriaceae cyanobacterium M33_DOE_052]